MVSLLQIRDLIALYGQADIDLLCKHSHAPQPMVQAMLEKLVAMGKLEKVDVSACLTSTSCKGCPESTACSHPIYKIK
ncbi:FeoC-like transcriptional regulator [Providencia vermicola]|uniref:Probable [Fe-S]-dependent transcriptional repressor n=1 Tax=Providencia vermicola TaxID=333965 RepID=A0AAX3S0H4_9GAMM|nr:MULTISPECIES: FeoC-like transcriptional regulator [Providencia]ELX8380156.1 ferrous iron transporter C [Providencia stuartii]EMD5259693.1 ferrous iron transporter C [Providencia stuartii]MBG5920457.1 ferrous iron transporter C [Providencia stuartii]USB38089.1 FeoC-like transcriptional regulator [Providencia vermicola]WFC07023.1 FeoC-like transcriptional regulator [Providencia vermicola]